MTTRLFGTPCGFVFLVNFGRVAFAPRFVASGLGVLAVVVVVVVLAGRYVAGAFPTGGEAAMADSSSLGE